MVSSQHLPLNEDAILQQIKQVKEYVHTHQNTLPNHIYQALDGLSQTMLAYNSSKGKQGWASNLTDVLGKPLWTSDEVEVLESALPEAIVQVGGGPLQFSMDSSLVQPSAIPSVSLDSMLEVVQNSLASLDEANRQLAKVLGPAAYLDSLEQDPRFGPFPPILPVSIPIPPRTILPMINAILETCRILTSSRFLNTPLLRTILSIVLGIFDVSRGEWKDGVLSLFGAVSDRAMFLGVFLKTARWVYNFISPDIQSKLAEDLWAGSKSAIIGGWLWLISITSPDYVRMAVNQMIETAKQPLEQLQQTMNQLEAQVQPTAAAMGAKVTFPTIPLDSIPSFSDIQNFQTLLHQPAVVCSPVFQQVIQPALSIPPLRLVLELLNVPTTPDTLAEMCKDQPASLEEAISKQLQPTITPL